MGSRSPRSQVSSLWAFVNSTLRYTKPPCRTGTRCEKDHSRRRDHVDALRRDLQPLLVDVEKLCPEVTTTLAPGEATTTSTVARTKVGQPGLPV